MNALKHGMTAREVVLSSENANAFSDRKEEWIDYYGPAGPAQRLMVERAVHTSWRLDRCARAETARLAVNIRHAITSAERAALDQAEALGRRLLLEPADRDPHSRREPDHAANLARALAATAQGVNWLLARWSDLRRSLDGFGHWTTVEKFNAVRLLGKRPEDCTDDPSVAEVFLACHAASPSPSGLWDDFHQSRIGVPGPSTDFVRFNALRKALPADAAAGRAALHALIGDEVARLTALKADGLDEMADAARSSAADTALFDGSHDGVLLRRYEIACERELRRAIVDVLESQPFPARNETARASLHNEPSAKPREPIAPASPPALTPPRKAAAPAIESERPFPSPPKEREFFRSPSPLHARIRLSGRRSR